MAVIVGTRPEAVKLAPVIKAIDEHPGLRRTLITTGQHEEMVTTVLDIFGLSSDVSLQLARTGQGLHELATEVISAVAPLFAELRPDAVVVQGDTTSAMAAALTAFHDGIPVAHVEAGLRTGDMANPFPEEANRRLISVLTTLHLPPTEKARQALVAEGIDGDDIVVTGNTVIDAMLETLARGVRGPDFAEVSDLLDQPVLLTTLHRREAWDSDLSSIARALRTVAAARPELQVVLPLHRNPRVRDELVPILGDLANIRLTDPLTYPTFVHLLARATLVLTDSGGVQEEAPSFGVPVLVARRATERTEAVDAGFARLIGLSEGEVVAAIEDALAGRIAAPGEPEVQPSPFGDGNAATRVVDALAWRLLPDHVRPADFVAPAIGAGQFSPTP